MAQRIEAIVKPEMLVWARETGGFSVEAAAKKAQIKPERLQSWEQAQRRPTINQLRKLANVYKRPLAAFYLPEPPSTLEPMRDFRRLPGQVAGRESPELRLEIRRARHRRQLALDLYEELEAASPQLAVSATLSDDREQTATEIRRMLRITYQLQTSWQSDYEAFNAWRSAFEANGVLVFQSTDVDLNEMRGFSISDRPLPALVVNVRDLPRARIFTMLHEFVHIMLMEAGLCDLDEDQFRAAAEQRVEVFCNHVAGAAIVPEEYLLRENIVTAKTDITKWSDQEIETLARRYKAGRETILRRLLIAGRTTEDFYRQKRTDFQSEYKARARRPTEGFAPRYRVAMSAGGALFTKLVLDAYYRERITGSDVCDFLEIRLKHLPRIEQELLARTGLSENRL